MATRCQRRGKAESSDRIVLIGHCATLLLGRYEGRLLCDESLGSVGCPKHAASERARRLQALSWGSVDAIGGHMLDQHHKTRQRSTIHIYTLILSSYRSSELSAGHRLDSRDLLLYALVVLGAVIVVQVVGLFSPRSAASRLVQEHLHRLEDLRRRTSRAGGQGEAALGVANRPVPRACLIVTDTDQLPP